MTDPDTSKEDLYEYLVTFMHKNEGFLSPGFGSATIKTDGSIDSEAIKRLTKNLAEEAEVETVAFLAIIPLPVKHPDSQ